MIRPVPAPGAAPQRQQRRGSLLRPRRGAARDALASPRRLISASHRDRDACPETLARRITPLRCSPPPVSAVACGGRCWRLPQPGNGRVLRVCASLLCGHNKSVSWRGAPVKAAVMFRAPTARRALGPIGGADGGNATRSQLQTMPALRANAMHRGRRLGEGRGRDMASRRNRRLIPSRKQSQHALRWCPTLR